MDTLLAPADWRTLLAAHPGLADLPASLRRKAVRRAFAANATLWRTGDRPRTMAFVVAGEVRLVRRSRNGAEIVLQRASGGFVAEASLESPRYHCDIVAASEGALLAFPMAAFRACLEGDARFQRAWTTRLVRELRKLRAQCERLSLRGAAERIEHYVEAEGTDGVLRLRQPRKAWAAELGLSHEALYRALASLERRGDLAIHEEPGAVRIALRARRN